MSTTVLARSDPLYVPGWGPPPPAQTYTPRCTCGWQGPPFRLTVKDPDCPVHPSCTCQWKQRHWPGGDYLIYSTDCPTPRHRFMARLSD